MHHDFALRANMSSAVMASAVRLAFVIKVVNKGFSDDEDGDCECQTTLLNSSY